MVYVVPGPLAARLSYHSRQSIKREVKGKLEFLFPCSEIKSGTKRKNVDSNQPSGSKKRKVSTKSSKAKGKLKADNRDEDEDGPANVLLDEEDISFLSDDEPSSQKILHKYLPVDEGYESIDLNLSDDNDDSTNNFAWSHSFLEEPKARFKPYIKKQTKASRSTMNNVQEDDDEVIMLSSD